MDQETFLEKINSIENNFPVNKAVYRSVHVWPAIRYLLLIRFKQGFTDPKKNNIVPATKLSFKNKVLQAYIGFRHYMKFKKQVRKLLPLINSGDIIVFSRAAEYTDVVNNKKYNRLIDPFIEYFHSKNIPVKKLETGNSASIQKTLEPVLIDDTDFGIYYRSKRLFRNNNSNDENTIQLLNETERLTKVTIHLNEVYKVLENSFYYRDLFKVFFKEKAPQAVFLSAYYDKDTFGLIQACRELNIPTVDIQHGKQGKFHFMYSHWTKIPDGGYALLPDYFWNWGKESEQNISRWMKGNTPHKPIVGGNLWMMRWKLKKEKDEASQKHFFENLKKYKRIILFSLQPIGSANFPEFILKAIEQTKEDCLWLLRLHPRMKKEDLPGIEEILNANKNTEMAMASTLPLFRLLEEASVHITCWSSVAFESLSFNVPTILIHPEAKSLYHDHIQAGTFLYSDDLQSFLSQVHAEKKELSSDYIVDDIQSADAALRAILHQ